MEYNPIDYMFPRAYVEGVESVECLVLNSIARVLRPCKASGGKVFGLTPYEDAITHTIDLVEAVTIRGLAILLPWSRTALVADRGVRVSLVEAVGVQVNHVAREGDHIEDDTILAYILTGKGETRTLKAGVEGILVYIGWLPGGDIQRYIYVIAPRNSVRVLEVEGYED